MEMDGDSLFLPQEIITNIVKRLPVKSLIQFQCVCKHWKHLINTPSFIADHFHHSSNQNPLLFLQWDASCDPLHLHLLDHEMRVLQVHPSPLIDSLSRTSGAKIVGSNNGLLCVEMDNDGISPPSILLWNPAIREVRQVPISINDLDGSFRLGFGFSTIANDCKIVISHETEFDNEDNQVEVYSLRTGSWKEIEVGNFGGVHLRPQSVTTNGAIFWHGDKQGEEYDDYDCMIVSFDIAKEVFTLIRMPTLLDNSNSFGRLTVYENKLAIFSATESGNLESFLIDLWVMEEGIAAFGEKWSWTKKYTVSTSSGMLAPYGICQNKIVCNVSALPALSGEAEYEVDNGVITVLSLFNLTTYELEDFLTRRCGVRFPITSSYAESLVPVLKSFDPKS